MTLIDLIQTRTVRRTDRLTEPSDVARRAAIGITLLGLVLALAYAVIVKPGEPYDEAAHFGVVQFWLHHWHMPVLGHHGVTYEAQMGPVYYVLSAILALPLSLLGRAGQLYGLRLAWAVLLVPQVGYLTYRMTQRISRNVVVSVAAVAFVVLNPLMLSMTSSVQNDVLAISSPCGASTSSRPAASTPRRSCGRPASVRSLVPPSW